MLKHIGKNLTIVLALVAVGFLTAWLRFRPYLGSEGRFSDGVKTYDVSGTDEVRYAVWAPRVHLSGEINSIDREGRAAISPDGRWMVFGVGERGLGADLYLAELVDGEPRDPRPLAALNTGADEMAPAFGEDALWFASDRRGTLGGLDLWRASYDPSELSGDRQFGEPERVQGGVNSTADDTDPAPLLEGSGFVFASNRRRGLRDDFELYVARPEGALDVASGETTSDESGRAPDDSDGADSGMGVFRVEAVAALNSSADEREPAFTRDGRALFLASDRGGEPGDFDLYRSALGTWSAGSWGTPEPLVGVNTAAPERAPHPSRDGFTLYFSSTRAGQGEDLFRARSLELFRTPGRPVGWRELLIIGVLLLVALLAWLAKRWEQVEIVYKCILISLVVHLFLMWWMRDVYPEGGEFEMQGESGRVRVRLLASDGAAGRNAERSGNLEVASARAEPAGPERQVEPRDSAAAELIRQASLSAPAMAVELPAPDPTLAPSRLARSMSTAMSASASVERAVTTRRDELAVELRSGAAADLAVEVSATERNRAAVSQPSVARIQRESHSATSDLGERDAPAAFVATEVDPAWLGERSSPVPDARESQAEPSLETRTEAVSLSQSGETFAPRENAAPELALESREFAGQVARAGASRPAPARSRGAFRADGQMNVVASAQEAPSPRGFDLQLEPNPSALEALPSRAPSQVVQAEGSDSTAEAPDSVAVRLPEASRPDRREVEPGPRASERFELAPQRFQRDRSNLTASVAPAPERVRTHAPAPRRRDLREIMERPAERAQLTPLAMAMPLDTALPERDRNRDWEQTPYQTRVGEAKVRAIEEYGGSEETERAVEAGLAYLARIRSPQGFWGSADDRDDKYGHVVVGKTGLSLLAFMGAGHTPGSETEYSKLTREAVDFLLTVQDESSGHFGYSSSYSHAIATYSLAECFAMTRSERLRAPLERAVAHILEHQERSNDRRFHGGWGYYYPDDREFDEWPRASVTVWQVMALESAKLGGLDVPSRAFEDAHAFLRNSWDTRLEAFRYSHDPARLRSNWPILPGSTPAALFALSLLGDDTASATFREARAFILERAPRRYRSASDDDFVLRARGNLYFWYYGTLALFRVGGKPWKVWNEAMKETLLSAQERNGSWEPISIYAEYAGDDDRDRSYTTAMCVLSLEVYYRYFTPLLKVDSSNR